MTRIESLRAIFEKVDEDKRTVTEKLLDEVVFLEEQLRKLRTVPHYRVHPKNPARQEITPAGKLYKENLQAYTNTLKVLQITLSRYSVEEKDAFDRWLEESGSVE